MSVSSSSRDSNALRASVLDVCLQLGALDDNSLVAEWMFSDPASGTTRDDERRRTVLAESISMGWEDTGMMQDTKHHTPFSYRASAFAAKIRPKKRAKSKAEAHTTTDNDTRGSGYVSLSRRSFFRRTTRKASTPEPRNRIISSNSDTSGHISTNPKSFFRLKPRSVTDPSNAQEFSPTSNQEQRGAPPSISPPAVVGASTQAGPFKDLPEILPRSTSIDDDWEEVEARPRSPLYALKNKGINPMPVIVAKKKRSGEFTDQTEMETNDTSRHSFLFPSIFRASLAKRQKPTIFRISPTRPNRKPTSLHLKHTRGHSVSLPASPFVLVTSHNTPGDPDSSRLTSRIVHSPMSDPPHAPVYPVSVSKAHRSSMGYHNQFFTDGPRSAHPKSASFPSLPEAMTSISNYDGRKIPFPAMSSSPIPHSIRALPR